MSDGPDRARRAPVSSAQGALQGAGAFVREVAAAWSRDRCFSRAAAVAFYTAFSIAPVLVIVLWLVGLFVDSALATDRLLVEMRRLVGPAGADVFLGALQHLNDRGEGGSAAIIAFGALLVGATTAFAELKESLDEIWGARNLQGGGIWGLLKTRLLALGMLVVLALLLLVLLAVNAGIGLLSEPLSDLIGLREATALRWMSRLVTVLAIALLFASIYKLLPSVSLRWTEVGRASMVTALLFMAGHAAISTYVGSSAATSAYGAAGSLAAVLLWIYYSALIFFLGAELTRAWVRPARQGATRGVPRTGEPPPDGPAKPPIAR